jgi:hypothetical protein
VSGALKNVLRMAESNSGKGSREFATAERSESSPKRRARLWIVVEQLYRSRGWNVVIGMIVEEMEVEVWD